MAKHFRVKKLINWTVQGPIVIRLIIHFMAYNVATLFLLLVVYGIKGSLAAIADQPVSAEPMTFWQQAAPVVVCMCVMMPFMIWDLMKLTNRIAGPLFRFESILNDFSKSGTIRQADLRKGDLLTDYQKHFNAFVDALHALHPETRPTQTTPDAVQPTPTTTVPIRKLV